MITEMYMVEKWEVVAIRKKIFVTKNELNLSSIKTVICYAHNITDVIFTIVFSVFWYINYSVVLGLISNVVDKQPVFRDFLHSIPGLHYGSTT